MEECWLTHLLWVTDTVTPVWWLFITSQQWFPYHEATVSVCTPSGGRNQVRSGVFATRISQLPRTLLSLRVRPWSSRINALRITERTLVVPTQRADQRNEMQAVVALHQSTWIHHCTFCEAVPNYESRAWDKVASKYLSRTLLFCCIWFDIHKGWLNRWMIHSAGRCPCFTVPFTVYLWNQITFITENEQCTKHWRKIPRKIDHRGQKGLCKAELTLSSLCACINLSGIFRNRKCVGSRCFVAFLPNPKNFLAICACCWSGAALHDSLM